MIDFLSLIGTFASILSLPLAIYFYLKTKDDKYRKIKSEIVTIILNHIGGGNNISVFNVESIIQTKLKEANFKNNKISREEVIDAVSTEIISNPLLSNDLKKSLLTIAYNLSTGQTNHSDYGWEEDVIIDDDEKEIPVLNSDNSTGAKETSASVSKPKTYGRLRDRKLYMRKTKESPKFNSEFMRSGMSIIVILTGIATSVVFPLIDSTHTQSDLTASYYITVGLFIVLISSVLVLLIQNTKK